MIQILLSIEEKGRAPSGKPIMQLGIKKMKSEAPATASEVHVITNILSKVGIHIQQSAEDKKVVILEKDSQPG